MGAFVRNFREEEWRSINDGKVEIVVAASDHQKGEAPLADVQALKGTTFRHIFVDISYSHLGDITIFAPKPFSGRI